MLADRLRRIAQELDIMVACHPTFTDAQRNTLQVAYEAMDEVADEIGERKMNAHWNTNPCRTCSAWDQHYPDNKQLGDCKRLPVLLQNGVLALVRASDWREQPEPTREGVALLRTTSDFGCTSYTPNDQDQRPEAA